MVFKGIFTANGSINWSILPRSADAKGSPVVYKEVTSEISSSISSGSFKDGLSLICSISAYAVANDPGYVSSAKAVHSITECKSAFFIYSVCFWCKIL